jgi:hypothetical protein
MTSRNYKFIAFTRVISKHKSCLIRVAFGDGIAYGCLDGARFDHDPDIDWVQVWCLASGEWDDGELEEKFCQMPKSEQK